MTLQTVLGRVDARNLGPMLPHEHILVGFIPDGRVSPADYDRDQVIRLMLPRLNEAKALGCTAIAECTPAFLGRDPELLLALSRLSGVHLITNTGYYQAPYLAPFVYEATARELCDIWLREAREGIGDSGVFPGFIKIALSNGGPLPPVQKTILEAAMRCSLESGLAIVAHTIGAEAGREAIRIMRQAGFPLSRFIWAHAHSAEDSGALKEAAGQGVWLSIDTVGWRDPDFHAALLSDLIESGHAGRILISHDAGWYHVEVEGGGEIRPYTPVFTDLIPLLRRRGVGEGVIDQLIRGNPAAALSIRE